MFERNGEQVLIASWAGPDTGGAKAPLGPGVLFQEIPSVTINSPPMLTSPGDQTAEQGDVVSLDLSATDEDGDSLYFDAAELPEGLAIDHESGRISGTVAMPGVSSVTASVSDGPGVSVVTFEWVITAPEPMPDGGLPDGGLPDGGLPDGGAPDGGIPDAGVPDAGDLDASIEPGDGSGGGCSVQSEGAPLDFGVLLTMLVPLLLRRRGKRD
jgi:hypothetical protein